MKVFKVLTRYVNYDKETNEVIETVQYVTQEDGNISCVAEYFQQECEQTDAELISVSYVIDIVGNIKTSKEDSGSESL